MSAISVNRAYQNQNQNKKLNTIFTSLQIDI